MKHSDLLKIINEHEKIDPMFTSSWKLKNKIPNNYKLLGVLPPSYKIYCDNNHNYIISDENDIPIGEIILQQKFYSQIFMVKKIFIDKQYSNKGIMKNALLSIIDNSSINIISDYGMTEDSENLFLSFNKLGKLYVVDFSKSPPFYQKWNSEISDDINPEKTKRHNDVFFLIKETIVYKHNNIITEDFGRNIPPVKNKNIDFENNFYNFIFYYGI